MKMCSLLSLYQYALAEIVSNWLTDEELCYLDSAACNHGIRMNFVGAMSKCIILNTNSDRVNRDEVYEWMNLRGMGLRSIRFRVSNANSTQRLMLLMSRTNRFDFLEFPATLEYSTLIAPITLKVNTLRLYGTTSDDVVKSFLNSCGTAVFDLDLSDCKGLSAEFFLLLPGHCPCLKRFESPMYSRGCVLLQSCDLDHFAGKINTSRKVEEENDVVLEEEVKAGEELSSYYGELQKTDHRNASTLEISGKSYFLTKLRVGRSLRDENVKTLKPLMSSLQSIHCSSRLIFGAVASQCTGLQSLTIDRIGLLKNDLISVCSSCQLLRRIELLLDSNVDSTIEAICKHCPLLEIFLTMARTSEDRIVQLFSACPLLVEASFDPLLPTSKVLRFLAENMRVLDVAYSGSKTYIKKEVIRGQQSLLIACSVVLSSTFSTLIEQNPSLRTITIDNVAVSPSHIESLVRMCPHLTSCSILRSPEILSNCLSHFTESRHLVSLSLRNLRKVTNSMVFELLKDKPNMLKLALPHCGGITGGILRIIAKYCILIRHVDVSFVEDVKSGDVIELLNGCYMLNYLDLKYCKAVSSDILPSIKSKRMRFLNLLGCNIFKETMVKYVSTAEFSSTCQLFY